jgi:hypothetical protein
MSLSGSPQTSFLRIISLNKGIGKSQITNRRLSAIQEVLAAAPSVCSGESGNLHFLDKGCSSA